MFLAVAATTVAGLVAETLLRVNGLLPSLTWSVWIFGAFVTLGIAGTLLLALTAPPVDPTVRVGLRLGSPGAPPTHRPPADEPPAADAATADTADEQQLTGV